MLAVMFVSVGLNMGKGMESYIIVRNNGNPAFEMFGHFSKTFRLRMCVCQKKNTKDMIDIWGWLMYGSTKFSCTQRKQTP